MLRGIAWTTARDGPDTKCVWKYAWIWFSQSRRTPTRLSWQSSSSFTVLRVYSSCVDLSTYVLQVANFERFIFPVCVELEEDASVVKNFKNQTFLFIVVVDHVRIDIENGYVVNDAHALLKYERMLSSCHKHTKRIISFGMRRCRSQTHFFLLSLLLAECQQWSVRREIHQEKLFLTWYIQVRPFCVTFCHETLVTKNMTHVNQHEFSPYVVSSHSGPCAHDNVGNKIWPETFRSYLCFSKTPCIDVPAMVKSVEVVIVPIASSWRKCKHDRNPLIYVDRSRANEFFLRACAREENANRRGIRSFLLSEHVRFIFLFRARAGEKYAKMIGILSIFLS